MNNADATKVKQQIVEKIKNSTNILVTVSRDPSVDDLSAAIGLSTILNKISKHSTAIFSGSIPPAISFLEPDKVFENTADSLRDFIIALDKEKADHLRYKVDGDVVKIFITPYHTTITSDDLDFSQGDFNVELVLALGVDNKEHLDNALAAHGQILNDVTIATFTAGGQTSDLGSMDWHDDNASSLSEMVTSISEALKTDKPILDKQIATALLTGIVAATDRFSNPRTTSKVMTMAAQLMAAGADQQLIAAKLRESHEINTVQSTPVETAPAEIPAMPEPMPVAPAEDLGLGGLVIEHEPNTGAVQYPPIDEPIAPVAPMVFETATPEVAPVENLFPEPMAPIEVTPSDNIEAAYAGPINTPAMKPEFVLPELPNYEQPAVSDLPDLSGIYQNIDQPAVEPAPASTLPEEPVVDDHAYLGAPSADTENASLMNSALDKEDNTEVDIFAQPSDQSTIPNVGIDLPLPPPLPDFSTLASEPLPNMNVVPETIVDTTASTLPPQLTSSDQTPSTTAPDPSQFHIPGQ